MTSQPTPRRAAWTILLGELDWWIDQHDGSSWVPQDAVTREVDGKAYPLGQRITELRRKYRRGALTAEQVREIEQRPGWAWDGMEHRRRETWNANYETLLRHYREHKTLRGLEDTHGALSRWLRKQRTAALTEDERQRLAKIPGALEDRKALVKWFVDAVTLWLKDDPDRTIAQLRSDTVHLIGRHEAVPIGRRAAYVRQRYADGKLDDQAIALIETIPGWTWARPRRARQSSEDQIPADD